MNATLLKIKLMGEYDFLVPDLNKILEKYPELDLIWHNDEVLIIYKYKDYYIVPRSFEDYSDIYYSQNIGVAIKKYHTGEPDTTLNEFMSWER